MQMHGAEKKLKTEITEIFNFPLRENIFSLKSK